MSDIPEWAWKRACALAGLDERRLKEGHYGMYACRAVDTFARYIAQHEQPPRDKLRRLARVLATEFYEADVGDDADDMAYALRKHLPAAAIKAIEEMGDD